MKIESIRNVVEELKAKVDNLPPSNSAKEKGDLYGGYFDKVGLFLSEETKIGTPDASYKEYLSVYQGWAKSSQEISEREEKIDTGGIVSLYENYFNELGRELETIANAAVSGVIGGAAGHIIPKSIFEAVNKEQLGKRLRNAAADGDIKAIQLLVDHGADVNAKENEYGQTPLHFAAEKGNTEAIKVLVSLGADVNAKDGGWTPLHNAAGKNHAEAIKVLVSLGADVNAKNEYDRVPLHFAAWYGHVEAIKALVDLGADVNAKNDDGQTPLHWAARNSHTEAIKVLSELGGRDR